jgi:hypothetical protein
MFASGESRPKEKAVSENISTNFGPAGDGKMSSMLTTQISA